MWSWQLNPSQAFDLIVKSVRRIDVSLCTFASTFTFTEIKMSAACPATETTAASPIAVTWCCQPSQRETTSSKLTCGSTQQQRFTTLDCARVEVHHVPVHRSRRSWHHTHQETLGKKVAQPTPLLLLTRTWSLLACEYLRSHHISHGLGMG